MSYKLCVFNHNFFKANRLKMRRRIKKMPKKEFQKTQRRVDQFQVLIVGPKLQNRLFR